MGLKGALQKAAKAVVKGLGDVAETITYRSFSSAPFSAASGTATRTETTITGVKVILSDYSSREIDARAKGVPGEDASEIRETDRKALIPSLSLSVIPKTSDRVERAGGEIWEVIKVDTDPATAAWVLQLRRP